MSKSLLEIQRVYESSFRGDMTRAPLSVSNLKEPTIGNHSYAKGQIPGATPGAQATYSVRSDSYGVEQEEESVIAKSKLIDRINHLMRVAEQKGTLYIQRECLFDLLNFIEKS